MGKKHLLCCCAGKPGKELNVPSSPSALSSEKEFVARIRDMHTLMLDRVRLLLPLLSFMMPSFSSLSSSLPLAVARTELGCTSPR
jgi:hypothetical protein